MYGVFKKLIVPLVVIGILAGGASLGLATRGGTAPRALEVNAATTQYGGECGTPGYWKNIEKHPYPSPWTPDTNFESVFGPSPLPSSLTLGEALELGGGGINALARQAAAALLNASKSTYAYIESEVIEMFEDAVASEEYDSTKNAFQAANEAEC